jgi:hypothetical protein
MENSLEEGEGGMDFDVHQTLKWVEAANGYLNKAKANLKQAIRSAQKVDLADFVTDAQKVMEEISDVQAHLEAAKDEDIR